MRPSSATAIPNVPNCKILQKLGSGTYATVYKAIRMSGARDVVAVKCVNKKELTSVSKENLLKEIELLKSLKHEHIVSLIDFVWDAQYIHIIMEYCSGGDLLKFIKQRRQLPESVCRRFLQQLALALEHLHSMNVVHMDLKPQNILLTNSENPVLKIADFGFAHHLSSERKADQLRGSLLYMAPEIITDRLYSPKCDLWSVGIILYECLFGQAPFASDSYEDLYRKILSDSPIQLPTNHELSDACCDLLTQLLQRDPNKRIDHPTFFQHPFIDLEHAPSQHCLPRGKQLVQQAVDKDAANDFSSALSFYKQALTFLVPALHYETDFRKKEQLRERIYEYMSRAEYLQNQISHGANAEQKIVLPSKNWDKLLELCKDNESLKHCIQQIKEINSKIALHHYEEAAAEFEVACERLLLIIKEEQDGERKTLLYELADYSLSQAENVRKYLKSRDPAKQKQQLADMEKKQTASYPSCSVM